MMLRPVVKRAAAPTESGRPEKHGAPRGWRWIVFQLPTLEGVSPRGEAVVIADRQELAAAREKHPDLPIWHEKEIALFLEATGETDLRGVTFRRITRLKLRCGGWFVGAAEESGISREIPGKEQ